MQNKAASAALAIRQAMRCRFDWKYWEEIMSKYGKWWENNSDEEYHQIEKDWCDFWKIFGDVLEENNILPLTREFINSGKSPMKHSSERKIWMSDITVYKEHSCSLTMYYKLFQNNKINSLKSFCVNMEYYLTTEKT